MSALMKTFRMVGIAVGAAAAVVILGCGDDSGLATRYKVSGTVKYKGQPVPKGSIVFEPTSRRCRRVGSPTGPSRMARIA